MRRMVSEKPFVFVSPIYSWRMPRVFDEFIRNSEFIGNDTAYFVMTCGGDMGAAGVYNRNLCIEKKLQYFGSRDVVMPDNYIIMFSAPAPDAAKEIVKQALPMLYNIADLILQGKHLPDKACGLADKIKSGVINEGFNKYFVKAKGFHATDKCISCGRCTEACTLNNIRLTEGRPSWGNDCTQCMACICGCPVEAIEYGKKTIGKVRYQCLVLKDE